MPQSRTNTMGAPAQSSAQVSTTTLLNALHNAYSSGQPYPLEPSTSLVVNTWVSATQTGADGRVGGTVDVELARRSWEHARRRAEDSAIVLGYVTDNRSYSVQYTDSTLAHYTDRHLRF
jgi:chitin synthase